MAGRRNLISDNSVYQSLLYQPIAKPEKPGKGDSEFRLATGVLRTLLNATGERSMTSTLS
jgi:hypothetical protein